MILPIHYFSSHNTKTDKAIVFILRAYRICSLEFIQDELDYIKKAFMGLKFPETMLTNLETNHKRLKPKH